MLFDKITIIGIGLIGSSLARVIMKKGLAGKLCACDKNKEYLAEARELGIVDEISEDLGKAVENADVVVVPGHPVAGTEKSGPANGFDTLFEGRWYIVTPSSRSTEEAVAKVSELWAAARMKVDKMTPEHHDKVMAAVSHLPHLIAYSIVGTVSDLEGYEKQEIIKYSASGFRDFTRIAGSDPTMWRDVFLNNKETILELIQRFVEDLIALERNIRWNEGDKLFELFSRTQKIRREVIEARQEQPEHEKRLLAEINKLDK